MKTIVNTIPGYRVYEYLLALNPHKELWDRVMDVKQEFKKKFQAEFAGGLPHITLVHFVQYAMMEERLINRLHVVAMGQPAIKVELKDFGSFPSHTIYINITSRLPVQSLVKAIRHDTQRLMTPIATGVNEKIKPHFMMEPHLTISRKLKPWQYEKGWLEYSNKHFTGRFIAASMILLRRPEGELKYQLLRRFEFQNMPVTTKQGELF